MLKLSNCIGSWCSSLLNTAFAVDLICNQSRGEFINLIVKKRDNGNM